MKVSTKGRYGLRALADLASHAGEGAVSLVSVSERQGISLNYLEQVFALLRRAGIVRSVKGFRGGYMLSRDPKELTIGEILTVLEGRFCITDEAGRKAERDAVWQSIQELVWAPINDAVNAYLDTTTLAQLMEEEPETAGCKMIPSYGSEQMADKTKGGQP